MEKSMRLEATSFPNAAPPVIYEVDASDALVAVNDAWQSFAIANGAPHLMQGLILGRSLWDFVSDDTTRLVYDVILRQVRNGARSRFEYRCDSLDRRRLMEMSIVPGRAGHVIFESATICVEWHRDPPVPAPATPARTCGWCKRTHTDDHGWRELGLESTGYGPGGPRTPVITDGMCADCYSRVMNSIDDRAIAPAVVRAQHASPVRAAVTPPPRRAPRRPRVVALPSRHAS
jgi:hypothetical protein